MARPAESVSRQVRRALVREAGGKCANPGCPSVRTHVHHVAYMVYATNDQRHLIAICPSCHDAVHGGELRLDDDTLYRWKALPRNPERRAHVYVEPGASSKLLLGSIAVTGPSGLVAFDLSPRNRLKFTIDGSGDILLLDLSVTSAGGAELVRVEKGYVRVVSEDVDFQHRPGHVRLMAPLIDEYLPTWALERLRVQEPSYGTNGTCVVLDLEVLAPGLVRVQGTWVQEQRAVVITPTRLAFIWPELQQPIAICGEGVESTLMYTGPIDAALFGFRDGPPSALPMSG
jgi:hypothetical protein